MVIRIFAFAALASLSCNVSFADQNTETFSITSQIHILDDDALGSPPTSSSVPQIYTSSGDLDPTGAKALLDKLKVPDDEPVIIHLLRWGDSGHKTVMFQKWYLYNAGQPDGGHYLRSQKQRFQDTDLPGVKNFRVLFIHLNFNLLDPSESVDTTTSVNPSLVWPVSYTVSITKKDTQFVQDVKTLLQIEGFAGAKAASAGLKLGYYGYADIESQFSTSTVTITPSLSKASPPTVGSTSTATTKAANTLTPNTYTNEGPTNWGLSAAVPVTSYKDVTYNSSGGTLTPKSTTQQNAYIALDGYFPAALPALMAVRYIPHPFVALPLAGKVFEHPMAGLAMGTPWFDVYAGAVFDRENGSVNGSPQHTTVKWSFGFKISMTALATALKSASSSSK
jgi:hypothetical protein